MAGIKCRSISIMLSALFLAFCSISAQAEIMPMAPQHSSAEILPESTIFMLEMRDLSETYQRVEGTSIYTILTDPQVSEYLAPFYEQIETSLHQMDGQLRENSGLTLDDLIGLVDGRVTLAVTDFSLLPTPSAKIVLLLTPTDTERMRITFDMLLPDEQRMLADLRIHQGVEIYQTGEGEMTQSWAIAANTLIMGFGRGAADDVIDLMANPGQSLLMGDVFAPLHRMFFGYDRDWLFYLNLETFINAYRALGGGEAQNVIRHFGLDNMRGIAIAGSIEGENVEDVFCMHMPRTDRGIPALLSPQPVDMDMIRYVPPDVISFSLFRMNPAPLYDFIMGSMQHFNREAHGEAMAEIQAFEEQMGFSVREDLLGSLGGEMISYTTHAPIEDLVEGLRMVEDEDDLGMMLIVAKYGTAVYMLTINDREAFAPVAHTLSDLVFNRLKEEAEADPDTEIDWEAFAFVDEDYRGADIRYLEGFDNQPLTPGYAVTDEIVIFTVSRDALVGAIDMLLDGGDSVIDTQFWADASRSIPEGSGGFAVFDLSVMVDYFPLIVEIARESDEENIQEWAAQMDENYPAPILEVIARKNMISVISINTIPGDGVAIYGRSPIGTTSIGPLSFIGGIIYGGVSNMVRQAGD